MRNLTYERIITEVAQNLSIPKTFVDKVYRSYWRAVREHISALPLKEDLSNEEFIQLQPNVNIPSIGKLYITLDKYRWYKEKFKYIKQVRESKNTDAEDNED